jgi:hypothetical protein
MAEPSTRPPWWSAWWAPWVYRVMMWGSAIAAAGFVIWLVIIIAYGEWTPGVEAARVDALAKALFGFVGCNVILTVGLVVRNTVRNLRGQAGLFSFEAESHNESK